MAMHPELEHAIKTELPIPELIKIFAKHYSGLPERYIDQCDVTNFESITHSDSSFWDIWEPLGSRMGLRLCWYNLQLAKDPNFSIRKSLTREIISWLCDSKRKTNIKLIAEVWRPSNLFPRAAVFASICCDANQLGAQTQISSMISIITQLAARYHPYRRLLAKRLIDNPRILELSTRARFRQLIYEPWKALGESHPQYIATPPVIVLFWNSDYDDEELLRSICEFSSSHHSSPLLWIISIDRSTKLPIHDPLTPFVQLVYHRLPICYDDGPTDAASILRHRFSDLRQAHEGMFDKDETWPSDEQMSNLIRITSGVFESIDVVINFMDREDGGGPKANLETFLAYMVDSPSPSDERPYCALDHFYTHAFSKIPPNLLPVASQALSTIHDGAPGWGVSPLQIACLFSTEIGAVLSAHAYLSGWAITGTEKWHSMNTFLEPFLKDPKRSGRFWHNPNPTRVMVLESFLHLLSHSSNLLEFLKSRVQSIPINPHAYNEIDDLRCMASGALGCFSLGSNRVFSKYMLTRRFDFRCLAYTSDKIDTWPFMASLFELYDLDKYKSPNIVRVEPAGFLDNQFIDKCAGLAGPLDLKSRHFPRGPEYVLLGFEDETVLVLFEDAGQAYEMRRSWKVDIYTSTMLDFM